jgi:F0F1-type ATP synthase assembly protein I
MNNNKFLRMANAGVQMGILIGGGAFGGNYLDKKYGTPKPYYTLVFSLLGVGIGLYLVIKEVINLSKNDE